MNPLTIDTGVHLIMADKDVDLGSLWDEITSKHVGSKVSNEEEVEHDEDDSSLPDSRLPDDELADSEEVLEDADASDEDDVVEDDAEEHNVEPTDAIKPSTDSNILEVKANGRIEKVDLSDKENVSKLLSKAYGADKAFREKAKLAKEYEALKAEADEAVSTVNTLKRVINDEGIDGLLRVLLGDENAAENYFKHKLDLYEASPEERERKEAVEKVRRLEKKMEREEAERKEREKKLKEQAEQEAKSTFKLRASDVYHSIKLEGDTRTVKMLNTQIWNEAIKELDSRHGSDAMLKASKKEIEAVFKEIAEDVKKDYRVSQKKAKAEAIGRSKQKAAKGVAADVRGGTKSNQSKEGMVKGLKEAKDEAELANAFRKFFGG